jgi:hypothetical protein
MLTRTVSMVLHPFYADVLGSRCASNTTGNERGRGRAAKNCRRFEVMRSRRARTTCAFS